MTISFAAYIVIAVLGLAGAIGAATVIVRSSAVKEARDSWRDNYESQKARADDLEAQVRDLTAQVAALTAQQAASEVQVANLRELVTGHREIAALSELVIKQHHETLAAINDG